MPRNLSKTVLIKSLPVTVMKNFSLYWFRTVFKHHCSFPFVFKHEPPCLFFFFLCQIFFYTHRAIKRDYSFSLSIMLWVIVSHWTMHNSNKLCPLNGNKFSCKSCFPFLLFLWCAIMLLNINYWNNARNCNLK